MKRVRLLIYEGSEEWLDSQRRHESVQKVMTIHGGWQDGATITSIELDPLRITVLELVRVLFGREWKKVKEPTPLTRLRDKILPRQCPRCLFGVDNDGDGNCSFCAKLTDAEAAAFHKARTESEGVERQ